MSGTAHLDRMSIGTDSGTDGNGRLLVDDARALTNGSKQGLIYAINCTSAAIDYDCVAEGFLFNPNGGAVCYIGSTNLDFPSAASSLPESLVLRSCSSKGRRASARRTRETLAEEAIQIGGSGENENPYRFLSFSLITLGDPQMRAVAGNAEAHD